MKKFANRILSVLLVLTLVLTMLPAAVFADGDATVLEGWNVTLCENIGINFHLDSADYTINTTVNGEAVTPSIVDNVVTVNIAAAQMTDEIGLTVFSDETQVHSGSYTVRQYAETILDGEYDDQTKQMVMHMLNYGAAAQSYFSYNSDAESLANYGYELESAVTVPSDVPAWSANDNLDGIDLYGATLIFRSKTAIRFYFTVSGDIADYTFTAGENTYQPVLKDGRYYVQIDGINPQELDAEVTISVNDGALTAAYSPLNYIVRKYYSDSSADALKTLVQAMYGYHTEAVSYQAYLNSEAIRPTEGNVVALNFHYIRESAPMSFITKNAYPAGSVITFKAYQPYISDLNNNWWGVGTTADASSGSIYSCAAVGNNMYSADNDDLWVQYSYTLPDGSEDSYFYIGGAKNISRIDDPLLIDDVVISTPDGNVYTDGFEYGLTAGLFNVNAESDSDAKAVTLNNLSNVTAQEALEEVKEQYGDTIAVGAELISTIWVKGAEFTVSWTVSTGAAVSDNKLSVIAQNEDVEYTLTVTVANDSDTASYTWNGTTEARKGNVAAMNIYYIRDSAPMSFITKSAYPAGTTITFEAFQPYISDTNNNWWGVATTSDASTGSIYTCAASGNKLYNSANNDIWAQYSYTIPADSADSYIYIAGAKNVAWMDLPLLIDNVVITTPDGTSVTDDFENGLTEGLFNVNVVSSSDSKAVTLYNLSAVTAQEALEDLKASYGDAYTSGTELVSSWTVDGVAFDVAWTADGAASVSGNTLTIIAQNEAADYTVTATVSQNEDTASYTWNCTASARSGNVAALTINKLNESTPMSLITTDAYAGGSTISFEAYVPTGASWWKVAYTTDPVNSVSIYKGTTMSSVKDQWSTYSLTLPDDGENYYIYFTGAKGEWTDDDGNALQLLIDNVTITSGDSVVTDDFEGDSLFDFNAAAALLDVTPVTATAQEALDDLRTSYGDILSSGTELVSTWTLNSNTFTVDWSVDEGASVASIEDGKLILTPQGTTVNYLLKATVTNGDDTASYSWIGNVGPQANTVAALTINKLNESTPMSLITTDAYAGGSTISFEAYVPTGASWWKVAYTTDPVNSVSIYKGTTMSSVKDQWSTYSLTLPDDGENYYIYFTGAKGEWTDDDGNALQLLIDNVTITSGDSVVTDDFEGDSLFDFNAAASLKSIEPEEETPRAGNYVAIYPDYLTEESPMSFITTEAYAGGSTVSLEAYVPSDSSWWAISWTTDPSDVGLYKWTSGLGSSMTSTYDAWANYSVTLPDDGNEYYVYIVGAKGEWNGNALLIDNVTIGSVTEDFEDGLDNSIFSYIARSSGGESLVELETYNYAQEITVANLTTGIKFITKVAFPAGSTVTFDAKVPEEHDWWALDWTTDPGSVNNESARYAHSTSGTTINSLEGVWSNYTVTLPDSGGPYHLYLAGPNEWDTNTLLIDNFKVTDADGNVLADENFNHSIADSIFVADTEVSEMSVVLSYAEDDVAEIEFTAYSAPTVNREVPADNMGAIGAAYRKMQDAGFNKALAVTEGLYGSVTATDIDEIKTQIAERSAYAEEVAQRVMSKAQMFGVTYYVKDWSLYNMGGLNTDSHGVNDSFGLTQEDFNDIISTMFDDDNPYDGNSGYAGHFGYDEPYYADLEKVGWAAEAYKATGVSGELFVNLLPTYVSDYSKQMSYTYTYDKYLDKYIELTEGYLDYICWDYYPFMNAQNSDGDDITDEQTTRIEEYLTGYEKMANAAKENDRELRIFIQSSGDSTGVKNLEGQSELNFQIYAGLSFGVKEFIYYMYSGNSTSGYNYVFNVDNQTYNDTVYGWAQDVNNDVHSFEEVYDEYQWSNVMIVDADSSSVMMNNLTGAVTSSDLIKVEGSGDYLVGLFTAENSASSRQNAFMLVNAQYDPDDAANNVVLTIPGASALSVWRDGQQSVIKLDDTQCILYDVQPGEGIFLVPLY